MVSVTGKPLFAYSIVGKNKDLKLNLPNFSCNFTHPSTAPGTVTGRGPYEGILLSPLLLK